MEVLSDALKQRKDVAGFIRAQLLRRTSAGAPALAPMLAISADRPLETAWQPREARRWAR